MSECICDQINARHCPVHYQSGITDLAAQGLIGMTQIGHDKLIAELADLRTKLESESKLLNAVEAQAIQLIKEKDHWYTEFCKLETDRASCCSEMELENIRLKAELDEIKAARAKCAQTICADCGSALARF